jgi:hypothetical protein
MRFQWCRLSMVFRRLDGSRGASFGDDFEGPPEGGCDVTESILNVVSLVIVLDSLAFWFDLRCCFACRISFGSWHVYFRLCT